MHRTVRRNIRKLIDFESKHAWRWQTEKQLNTIPIMHPRIRYSSASFSSLHLERLVSIPATNESDKRTKVGSTNFWKASQHLSTSLRLSRGVILSLRRLGDSLRFRLAESDALIQICNFDVVEPREGADHRYPRYLQWFLFTFHLLPPPVEPQDLSRKKRETESPLADLRARWNWRGRYGIIKYIMWSRILIYFIMWSPGKEHTGYQSHY